MKSEAKRKWICPEVHTYGTFGAVTQGDCPKAVGSTDSLVFEGPDGSLIGLTCAS